MDQQFYQPELMGINSLSYVSMTNKKCKLKSEIISVNSNEHVFYSFSIKTSKCSVVTISIIYMQKFVFLML